LESRIDREFDRYTAFMLRNSFEVKGVRDYVLVSVHELYVRLGLGLMAAVAGRPRLCERAARRGAPEGAGDAGPAAGGSAHKDRAGTLRRREGACGTARRR